MRIVIANRTYEVRGTIGQLDDFIGRVFRGHIPWDAAEQSRVTLVVERERVFNFNLPPIPYDESRSL